MRRLLFIFLVLGLNSNASASKLSRAFQALEIYNYFQAKKLFEKTEKKHAAPSSYGLSVIYQRSDNPFFNLDSAYVKIVKSFYEYSELSLKKKVKYAKLGVDSTVIIKQRSIISNDLYKRALENLSLNGMNSFIAMNPWSIHVLEAVYKRDSIAFADVSRSKTAQDFKGFMETYPSSSFYETARAGYDKQVYIETTADNTLSSYLTFVNNYPESPYRDDAEDVIYALSTETGTVESYRIFIENNPHNRNIPFAWRKLYNAFIGADYSMNQIEAFKESFPDYPYLEEVEAEIELMQRQFLPIKKGESWSFVEDNGNSFIEANFEGVDYYSEGLAIVRKNGLYGYLNKRGDIQIPADFSDALPFKEGHALVEKDDKWGIINRNGEFIVPAAYEDLGELNEGLAFFEEDGFYGYFDAKGFIRLKPTYTQAYNFSEGKAVVSYEDYYGVIDPFGTTLIPFYYNDLKVVNDSIYLVEGNEGWGVINQYADTLVDFNYDFIGKPKEGWMIVELDGLFNYLNLTGDLLLSEGIETYPEYRQLAVFKNGYAKIETEDGVNLLGQNGEYLFAKPKEDLGDYNDFIAVKKKGQWGYINQKGTTMIDYNFSIAKSFGKSFGFAGKEPLIGMIDRSGKYIIEPYFENLILFNDSLVLAESRGLWGILNTQGDTLLPFNYVSLEPISPNIVEVERDNRLYYYNLSLTKIVGRKE